MVESQMRRVVHNHFPVFLFAELLDGLFAVVVSIPLGLGVNGCGAFVGSPVIENPRNMHHLFFMFPRIIGRT